MLTHEENESLTRIGPGTPMGALMRRYWIPALFSHQIPSPDCPPVRVKLLAERLVAFRDTDGRAGLLAEACPHRTASLFFGRNEECGLRCVYHGWKFDVDGNCVDMPSEPPGSNFKHKVKATAYPCLERGGLVWAYMGPAAQRPAFPEIEWAHLPEAQRHVTRHIQECNWLQAVEGGFDTSHLTFLHKGTVDGMPRAPERYEYLVTDFGFVSGTARELAGGERGWATAVMFMPFHKLISTTPLGAHAWVPIDDETTMNYCVDYNPHRPLAAKEMEKSHDFSYIHTRNIPGTDRPEQNRDNDYLIDRALQASGKSFTGIYGLGVQDGGIQESMGRVADRTVEHLGVSDTAIIKLRRLFLQALKDVDAGRPPPGLDAASYRVRAARFKLPAGMGFEQAYDEFVRIRDKAAAE
jgi:phenylpropionate dioxygenase-like ring-hydroxylating dioxygenase large terminal subunit